jgi:hypothetical protein
MGRRVEVLVKGPADEEGFVQGHTQGNHVTLVNDALEPGIQNVTIVRATPNRLYATADSDGRVEVGRARAGLYQLTSTISKTSNAASTD